MRGGRVGPARNHWGGSCGFKHRKRLGKHSLRLARFAHHADRNGKAERLGAKSEHRGIADKHERRNRLARLRGPGGKRDVRTDPRGIAERESKRAHILCHGARASTKRALAVFDESLLADVAQQALRAQHHLLVHQFPLRILAHLVVAHHAIAAHGVEFDARGR